MCGVFMCVDIQVGLAREVHAVASEIAVSYLDAPVSGGPEGASQGTLTFFTCVFR